MINFFFLFFFSIFSQKRKKYGTHTRTHIWMCYKTLTHFCFNLNYCKKKKDNKKTKSLLLWLSKYSPSLSLSLSLTPKVFFSNFCDDNLRVINKRKQLHGRYVHCSRFFTLGESPGVVLGHRTTHHLHDQPG